MAIKRLHTHHPFFCSSSLVLVLEQWKRFRRVIAVAWMKTTYPLIFLSRVTTPRRSAHLKVVIIGGSPASFCHVGRLRLWRCGRVVISVCWVPFCFPAVIHATLVGSCARSGSSCYLRIGTDPGAARTTPLVTRVAHLV